MWAVLRKAFVQANTVTKDASFHFIGSHPMAGSEKSGMEHASVDLLKQATCIITPMNVPMHSL